MKPTVKIKHKTSDLNYTHLIVTFCYLNGEHFHTFTSSHHPYFCREGSCPDKLSMEFHLKDLHNSLEYKLKSKVILLNEREIS